MTPPRHFPVVRLVLPPDDGWTTLAWLGFAADGSVLAHGESVPAELPAADELEILLPARRVAVHELTLPAQAGKHLDALIGQALEDRLLGDKADALALPGPPQGTQRRVWVCSRRWLEAGLEHLVAAGRYPSRLVPEYELLPEGAEATMTATTAGGTLFRTVGGQFGLVNDETTIPPLTGGVGLQRVPDLVRRPCPADCLMPLPKSLSRFNRRGFDVRQWYRSLTLGAASAALLLLGTVFQWQQLERRESRLQHEIRQTFATAFPGTPIVDPVLQWESKQRERAPEQGDALNAVILLSSRLDVPLRPRRIEAGDGYVRLVLTDSEVAQFKAQLNAIGQPETSPGEPGLTRLNYSLERIARR